MEYGLAAILLAALVAMVVMRPFVSGAGEEAPAGSAEREELEAAKEAKYREIRDARLDLEMGKLSKDDHRQIDRELRADAIAILKRLDELDGKAPEA
jgi:hypothetical protein